jgi:hypothetical protein
LAETRKLLCKKQKYGNQQRKERYKRRKVERRYKWEVTGREGRCKERWVSKLKCRSNFSINNDRIKENGDRRYVKMSKRVRITIKV